MISSFKTGLKRRGTFCSQPRHLSRWPRGCRATSGQAATVEEVKAQGQDRRRHPGRQPALGLRQFQRRAGRLRCRHRQALRQGTRRGGRVRAARGRQPHPGSGHRQGRHPVRHDGDDRGTRQVDPVQQALCGQYNLPLWTEGQEDGRNRATSQDWRSACRGQLAGQGGDHRCRRYGATVRRFDDDAATIQALLSGQVQAVGGNKFYIDRLEAANAGTYERKIDFLTTLQRRRNAARREGLERDRQHLPRQDHGQWRARQGLCEVDEG